MGIEQGTPVVNSSADLPLHKDLIDLRLPRAFRAWTDFQIKHIQQIAGIGTLKLEEIVSLGDELSASISQAIGINAIEPTSHISRDKIIRLASSISGKGNRIIFMRHGEQSSPEWIFSIPNPGLRKIRMMQNPFNEEDLLTNRGLVDVFTTAFILLYVKETAGRKVRVLSSENKRAVEVAEIISTIIPDATYAKSEGLSCITYRDERDDPPVSLEDILADLPSGFMPWEPTLVDKLCKDTKGGVKQSAVIVGTISDLMTLGTDGEGNELYVVLTHNQQLAEVLREVGKLDDPAMRFPELTMLVLGDINDCLVLEGGILTKQEVMEAIV